MKREAHVAPKDGPLSIRYGIRPAEEQSGSEDPNRVPVDPIYCDAFVTICAVPIGEKTGYAIVALDKRPGGADNLFEFMAWIAFAHRLLEDPELPPAAQMMLKLITMIESDPKRLHNVLAVVGGKSQPSPVRHGVSPRMRRGRQR